MYKVIENHLNYDPKVVNKQNILFILFISGNEVMENIKRCGKSRVHTKMTWKCLEIDIKK